MAAPELVSHFELEALRKWSRRDVLPADHVKFLTYAGYEITLWAQPRDLAPVLSEPALLARTPAEVGAPLLTRTPGLRGERGAPVRILQRQKDQVQIQILDEEPGLIGWVLHRGAPLRSSPSFTALLAQVDPQHTVRIAMTGGTKVSDAQAALAIRPQAFVASRSRSPRLRGGRRQRPDQVIGLGAGDPSPRASIRFWSDVCPVLLPWRNLRPGPRRRPSSGSTMLRRPHDRRRAR